MILMNIDDQLSASIVHATIDACIVVDLSGGIVAVNPATETMVGRSAAELVGAPASQIITRPSGRATDPDTIDLVDPLSGAAGSTTEVLLHHRDGRAIPAEMSVASVEVEGRRLLAGIARDITRRKRSEQELLEMATIDDLTGIGNRSCLHRVLVQARSHADLGWKFGILFLDLDGFKAINDVYGHGAGDDVLREAARRLTGAMRHNDTVTRYGGDEFVVVLESAGDVEADAAVVADRIKRAFAEPFELEGEDWPVGVSIGIATYPADGTTVSQILTRADAAMYASRRTPGSATG